MQSLRSHLDFTRASCKGRWTLLKKKTAPRLWPANTPDGRRTAKGPQQNRAIDNFFFGGGSVLGTQRRMHHRAYLMGLVVLYHPHSTQTSPPSVPPVSGFCGLGLQFQWMGLTHMQIKPTRIFIVLSPNGLSILWLEKEK